MVIAAGVHHLGLQACSRCSIPEEPRPGTLNVPVDKVSALMCNRGWMRG